MYIAINFIPNVPSDMALGMALKRQSLSLKFVNLRLLVVSFILTLPILCKSKIDPCVFNRSLEYAR